MGHLALYREWRPQTFDQVVAQQQVVYPLQQQIASGEIAHAYLFAGTRGTGKTSLAKIFAKAVNCLHPEDGNPCNQCEICRGINDGSLLDVLEIDAASNNSVDNIRRVTDEIVFTPTQAKYKVYIIDEVHMLSQSAFNALLKTLEEPPAHAIFILATTEPHRIPATILSRCQRYEFRRIPQTEVVNRLKAIADQEKITITPEALQTIARLGDGALRDSISLLDQCRSASDETIQRDHVLQLAGLVQDDFLNNFAEDFLHRDVASLLKKVEEIQQSGRSLPLFVESLIHHFRNLLIAQISPSLGGLMDCTDAEAQLLKTQSQAISTQNLMDIIREFSEFLASLKWVGDPRTAFEIRLLTSQKTVTTSSETSPAASVLPVAASSHLGWPATVSGNQMRREEPTSVAPASSPILPAETKSRKIDDSDLKGEIEQSPTEENPDIRSLPEQAPTPKEAEISAEKSAPLTTKGAGETTAKQKPPLPEDLSASFPMPSAPASESSASKKEQAPLPADPVGKNPSEVEVINPDSQQAAESPRQPSRPRPKSDSSKDKAPQGGSARKLDLDLWEKTLDQIRKRCRIDLIFLTSPAQVLFEGNLVRIRYAEDQPGHYKTVSKPENVTLMEQCLQEAGFQNGRVQVEWLGDPQQIKPAGSASVNPPEPAWFQRLRETGKTLNIPVRILESSEQEAPDSTPQENTVAMPEKGTSVSAESPLPPAPPAEPIDSPPLPELPEEDELPF